MQKKPLWIGLALVLEISLQVNAQNSKQDSTYRKWFVGSSLLMLGNFSKVNNPEYVQLNVGYRITPKDVVSFAGLNSGLTPSTLQLIKMVM